MALRVTCISKSGGYHEDPHHAISKLGYIDDQTNVRGSKTREEMWTFVSNNGTAYVKDSYGNVATVVPRTNQHGTRYVQTVADGKYTDNLLHLPEC